ncbi:MAG: hypothetical protein QM639_11990, partial [Rhodocyclaceae bacterium]
MGSLTAWIVVVLDVAFLLMFVGRDSPRRAGYFLVSTRKLTLAALDRCCSWVFAFAGVRWPGLAPAGELLSCTDKKGNQRNRPHIPAAFGGPLRCSLEKASAQLALFV